MASIIGRRFGKLKVIDYCMDTTSKPKVVCKCDCGRVVSVYTSNLYSGRTKSCGCSKTNHGESQTRLYRRYAWMRSVGSDFESYEDFKSWLTEQNVKLDSDFRTKRIDTKLPFSRDNCEVVVKG